jgi:hypothetical protein
MTSADHLSRCRTSPAAGYGLSEGSPRARVTTAARYSDIRQKTTTDMVDQPLAERTDPRVELTAEVAGRPRGHPSRYRSRRPSRDMLGGSVFMGLPGSYTPAGGVPPELGRGARTFVGADLRADPRRHHQWAAPTWRPRATVTCPGEHVWNLAEHGQRSHRPPHGRRAAVRPRRRRNVRQRGCAVRPRQPKDGTFAASRGIDLEPAAGQRAAGRRGTAEVRLPAGHPGHQSVPVPDLASLRQLGAAERPDGRRAVRRPGRTR